MGFVVIYDGVEYDIENFLGSHPAGDDILLPLKDKDITQDFNDVGHSKGAKRILEKYRINKTSDATEQSGQSGQSGQSLQKEQKEQKEEKDNVLERIKKRLFTVEDRFFIHKIMGAFALGSFGFRYFYMLPTFGTLGFTGSTFDIITLISHFFLTASSLIFHVLDKRIVEHPLIIYEEYRQHAIVFTTRAILISLIGLYGNPSYYKYITSAMLLITTLLVDFITYRHGTKGITTVRNNNDGNFKQIRLFYSFYQFCAMASFITMNQTDMRDLGYNTLIAIQSSTFLMTLKRKSLIRWTTHTLWYSLALLLSEYTMYKINGHMFFLQVLMAFYLRVKMNMSKYAVWAIYATFIYSGYTLVPKI